MKTWTGYTDINLSCQDVEPRMEAMRLEIMEMAKARQTGSTVNRDGCIIIYSGLSEKMWCIYSVTCICIYIYKYMYILRVYMYTLYTYNTSYISNRQNYCNINLVSGCAKPSLPIGDNSIPIPRFA